MKVRLHHGAVLSGFMQLRIEVPPGYCPWHIRIPSNSSREDEIVKPINQVSVTLQWDVNKPITFDIVQGKVEQPSREKLLRTLAWEAVDAWQLHTAGRESAMQDLLDFLMGKHSAYVKAQEVFEMRRDDNVSDRG